MADHTVTVNPGGGADYTSLEAAVHAHEGDWTGAGNDGVLTINCAGTTADTAGVTIHNYTFDATHYLQVIGDAHTGVWDTGHYRISLNSAYADGIDVLEPYTRIYHLQVENTHTDGHDGINYNTGVALANDNCILDSTIVRKGLRGANSQGVFQLDGKLTCINCIAYQFEDTGFDLDNFGANGPPIQYVYNCVSCGNLNMGFSLRSGSTIKNCYAGGNTGADFSVAGCTTAENSSEDLTGNHTGIAYSTAAGAYFHNITVDAEDFDITVDSALKDAGADLSAIFTTDIANQARGATFDIGAFEYQAAGGAIPLLFGGCLDTSMGGNANVMTG